MAMLCRVNFQVLGVSERRATEIMRDEVGTIAYGTETIALSHLFLYSNS